MPELPEVETIVRGLAPRLAGRRILAAEFRCARVIRGAPERIVGKTIDQVRRHGKFIVIDFTDSGGVIGPIVSAKLAKDFAQFSDAAKAADAGDSWYFENYCKWQQAFELAADAGAVDFH